MVEDIWLAVDDHALIDNDFRQRANNFREMNFRVLIATDIAARGLDVPHIEHVINYDLPQCAEDYIHRIGRTARAGAEGFALNLVTPADKGKWRAIDQMLNPHAQNREKIQNHKKKRFKDPYKGDVKNGSGSKTIPFYRHKKKKSAGSERAA